jgi:hypothetical protein
LDDELLGRLAQLSIERFHLVECCAPLSIGTLSNRPQLEKFAKFSGKFPTISRHSSPLPLVKRLVHPGSGIQSILQNSELKEMSLLEHENLTNHFGRVPW